MHKPRGYLGKRHETIGSDILAVLGVTSMPRQTLGDALHRQLGEVKPDRWYEIELMLDLMDTLERKVGPNALRQMGRKLFELSHEAHVKTIAKSAADVLGGFDELYRRANRGEQIGGWRVLSFGPGRAALEKTTPHNCLLEEGIMTAALAAVGVPATIRQEPCLRQGHDCCVFNVTTIVTDDRWGRMPSAGG